MHHDHACFVRAIRERRKVRLIYRASDDERDFKPALCVPLAYVPGRRSEGESDNYHFLDIEQSLEGNPLDLKSDQIVQIRLDQETFDPAVSEIWDVYKKPPALEPDWGEFS